MSRAANKADVLTRFKGDTATHQMTILRDDGVYRHLCFRRPGTSCYGFDIVTWPGHLAVSGDMGSSVFTRLDDMFEFFRTPEERHEEHNGLYINSGYWAEKCVANDGEKKEFSLDLFKAYVRDHFDQYMENECANAPGFAAARDALWAHLSEEVLDSDELDTGDAIMRLYRFKPGEDNSPYGISADPEAYKGWFTDFQFSDAWEAASSLEDYTFHFLWRLYAISHAVRAYDAAKAAEPAATAEA
jgi:hypothetical protein